MAADDVFRLPVDRAFTVKGTGTVVTGTVWSGELVADESVRILPAGRTARVRRIEQHGNSSDRRERVVGLLSRWRGSMSPKFRAAPCSSPTNAWTPDLKFEAVVRLESESRPPLTARTRLRLHAGASEVGARLASVSREARFSGTGRSRALSPIHR